jgi:hypothetical protein
VLEAVSVSVTRRYRAPAEGGVLAEPPFPEIASQLQANRGILNNDSIRIDGTPLSDFRREAIADVLAAARQYHRDAGEPIPDFPNGPLMMSGHQPELTHVGVLVKTFALHGLARKHGLTPLNLIVDNDTAKTTAARVPVLGPNPLSPRSRSTPPPTEAGRGISILPSFTPPRFRGGDGGGVSSLDPSGIHLLSVPYDRFEGEVPFETRAIVDPVLFESFPDRVMPIARSWGFQPILPEFWDEMRRQRKRTPILGEIVAGTRRFWERRWGCQNLEIPLGRMCATNAFQRFARHIISDLPRFHAVYNECVAEYRQRFHIRSRNHPVPDLHRDGNALEAPFWSVRKGNARRSRLMVRPGEMPLGPQLRSRALTTTMFLRVCLSDGFIHGIGGAKYDEVTDAILARWLGIEAPGFVVITATLRLPLPRFPTTSADLHTAERRLRDLEWNPQRYLEDVRDSNVSRLIEEKERLIKAETAGKTERKAWFRKLSDLTGQLRPFVADRLAAATKDLERYRIEASANELLMRRDFAWCMFPEEVVSGFCRQLL